MSQSDVDFRNEPASLEACEKVEAERDAALAQVAALREALREALISVDPLQDQPPAWWDEGMLTLADTAAAAAVHDERVRLAERQRIAEAVRGLPSFDDAVDRPAVLAIVEAPDA